MDNSSFFNQIIKTLSFPFKDPAWVRKTLIGGAIMLSVYIIPLIPAILISGYCMRIMKRIILENGEPYLPEWDDWGNLISSGIKLWGAGFIYTLPVVLVMLFGFVFLFFGQFIFMFNTIGQPQNSDPNAFLQSGMLFIGGMIIFTIIMFVDFFLGFLIGIINAPSMGHVAATDSFSAAFRVQEWWPILKGSLGAFLIVIMTNVALTWLVFFAVQMLSLTIILIFILPFAYLFQFFFISLYSHTFYAMAYRDGTRKLSASAVT